jgi:hypothetical protein
LDERRSPIKNLRLLRVMRWLLDLSSGLIPTRSKSSIVEERTHPTPVSLHFKQQTFMFLADKRFLVLTAECNAEERFSVCEYMDSIAAQFESEGTNLLKDMLDQKVSVIIRTASGRGCEISGKNW